PGPSPGSSAGGARRWSRRRRRAPGDVWLSSTPHSRPSKVKPRGPKRRRTSSSAFLTKTMSAPWARNRAPIAINSLARSAVPVGRAGRGGDGAEALLEGRVVEPPRDAAQHGEVGRAEEQHVHPLDRGDRMRVGQGALVLDLDDDERLLVGGLDVLVHRQGAVR